LYVVSNNNFNIPYYSFLTEGDINVDYNNILPKKIEISKTSIVSNQNLTVK
jgi:hypothetical protein